MKRDVELADVEQFLRRRYGSISDVSPLEGGAWSRAFGFSVRAQALVVLPAVIDIGEALDGVFAVSERLDGDRLDALPADRLAIAIDSLIEPDRR